MNNEILIWFLKALRGMFGQQRLWEAVKTVVETRGKIKIAKFDLEKEEGLLLREIEYDIKEAKAAAKLEKIIDKKKRKKEKDEKKEGKREKRIRRRS